MNEKSDVIESEDGKFVRLQLEYQEADRQLTAALNGNASPEKVKELLDKAAAAHKASEECKGPAVTVYNDFT